MPNMPNTTITLTIVGGLSDQEAEDLRTLLSDALWNYHNGVGKHLAPYVDEMYNPHKCKPLCKHYFCDKGAERQRKIEYIKRLVWLARRVHNRMKIETTQQGE
jgi:hypothetical protein